MAKPSRLIFAIVSAVFFVNSHVLAEKLTAEFVPMFEKCERGSALDGYMCLIEVLAVLDQMLKQTLDAARAGIDRDASKEEAAEIGERLVASQVFWRAFRHEYCTAASGYYSKAGVTPPSQSQFEANCEARKTVERILELRRDYPPP